MTIPVTICERCGELLDAAMADPHTVSVSVGKNVADGSEHITWVWACSGCGKQVTMKLPCKES